MKNIRIDGVIGQSEGEISAEWFRSQLPKSGTEPIRVSIHSEGGSVFEGFAIHDAIAAYTGPKVAAIESTAFSIASYIATAFDEVEMAPNAYLMLHNPRIEIEGDDEELTARAGMMASLKTNMVDAYASRCGKTADEIKAILKAETYFNATDAVAIGLADRVSQKPINARAFARLDNMPHGVVTALFGAGSSGDSDSKKGQSMTESTPVAATVKEIKAAYPKAKADFIVRCLEKSMPLASVATAAAEELMAENEELMKKVEAMEEEMAKAKAKAEDDEDEPEAEDDEDEPEAKAEYDEAESKAKARARGVKPVAKGRSGRPSASARWNDAVESALKKTNGDKMRAVALASRNNPGLREAYVAEVNAR
jgi:ATP-dependent protease ClpP protease subunit